MMLGIGVFINEKKNNVRPLAGCVTLQWLDCVLFLTL